MRSTYRRGEFEARNRQLPADLNQTIAFAVSAKSRADFDVTPVGTPPICYDVRSVFDARPINTYDFKITQSGSFTFGNDILLEMTVPEGYMAVLRSLEYWTEGATVAPLRSSILMSVLLNGGNYPNNVDIPVGIATDGPMPFFLLADEFNRIGVRFTYSSTVDTFYTIFAGNFILKTGRPYAFEIANPSNAQGCSPTAARRTVERNELPPAIAPPAIAPPLIAPAPVVPHKVTFRITKSASGLGAKGGEVEIYLVPMLNGKDMTKVQVRQYLQELLATPFSARDRKYFQNFLSLIGVA